MPPRAISPKSCSRAERSAGSGISGECGLSSGSGRSAASVSWSTTRGSGPAVAVRASRTLAAVRPPSGRSCGSPHGRSRGRRRGRAAAGTGGRARRARPPAAGLRSWDSDRWPASAVLPRWLRDREMRAFDATSNPRALRRPARHDDGNGRRGAPRPPWPTRVRLLRLGDGGREGQVADELVARRGGMDIVPEQVAVPRSTPSARALVVVLVKP